MRKSAGFFPLISFGHSNTVTDPTSFSFGSGGVTLGGVGGGGNWVPPGGSCGIGVGVVACAVAVVDPPAGGVAVGGTVAGGLCP